MVFREIDGSKRYIGRIRGTRRDNHGVLILGFPRSSWLVVFSAILSPGEEASEVESLDTSSGPSLSEFARGNTLRVLPLEGSVPAVDGGHPPIRPLREAF